MTEAEWLASTDAVAMLEHLDALELGSPRRIRLLRVAAARSVWDELADGRLRAAVEVAERYADGLSNDAELDRYRGTLYQHAAASDPREWASLEELKIMMAALSCVNGPVFMSRLFCGNCWYTTIQRLGPRLPPLIRDLFNNPFRPAPASALDLRHLTPEVVALAHAIYDGRDFGRMPQLAVALQAAGCDSADLLAHCRSAGPHARGCWALDLILGRH